MTRDELTHGLGLWLAYRDQRDRVEADASQVQDVWEVWDSWVERHPCAAMLRESVVRLATWVDLPGGRSPIEQACGERS